MTALSALAMPAGRLIAGGTSSILSSILDKAHAGNWENLPFGELMGKVGLEFVGTPYEGGTLESTGREQCRVVLDGLDCVTYFESVLAIAWMIKNGKTAMSDLVDRVEFTRYRGGKLNGYTSRLHYTAEWIKDNIKKGTVTDVTPSLGGSDTYFNVNFMSKHPQYYGPLKKSPKLVQEISEIETSINATKYAVIPQDLIAKSESGLKTGDIIAVTTSKRGLDYSHTGMILVKDGVAHFMHASSTHKKVLVDDSVSKYVKSVKAHTGITAVRPTGR